MSVVRMSDAELEAFRGTGPDDDGIAGRILGADVRKHRVSVTEAP